jgi:hypothetical protein
MSFQIIVISKNQSDCLAEMSEQLEIQFPKINRLFVLDRCVDNSVEILKKKNELFVENKDGEGFLAGKMRDLGLSYFGLRNTLFLDGDRVPVNFSIDIIQKALELYDICLISIENDCRHKFKSEFILNPVFKSFHNDVFSCGFCIRQQMIEKVISLQKGRLFNKEFDGVYGEEDRYLGDVICRLNGTCGLFPKQYYLKGEFSKIENRIVYNRQICKRHKLRKTEGNNLPSV